VNADLAKIIMTTTLLTAENNTKKHEMLEATWRRYIQEGTWQPGDRLPTFTEIADQYDVSRTTIDRVCRSLEQDGLIVRRQGSGTYVAPPQPPVKQGLIGFRGYGFQEKPRSSYWAHLQEGIEEVAKREHKAVVLLDYESPAGWDKVDGVLLADATPANAERLSRNLPDDMPRVTLLSATGDQPCVIVDEAHGGQTATQHLLSLGHRRIACIMNESHPSIRRRLQGYREALWVEGVEPQANWVRAYNTENSDSFDFAERGAEVMRQWLQEDWHQLECTALLVQNDLLAAGVLRVCQEAGIDIPGQLSIVGHDNLEICAYLTPALTSMEMPLHAIGVTAMEMLLHQIESGRRTPATTMLPVPLRIRESTASPAATVRSRSTAEVMRV
jgi:DNA-binding LacI/PurR family transcriptional regulator